MATDQHNVVDHSADSRRIDGSLTTPRGTNALFGPHDDYTTPSRTYVKPGDLLYWHHHRAHAFLEPTGHGEFTFEWLDAPVVEAEWSYTQEELMRRVEHGSVDILAEGIESVAGFQSLAELRTYLEYDDADPRLVNPGGAPSTDALSLTVERGTNSKARIDGFLKHPAVGYDHKPTHIGTYVALTARYNGRDVAMAVLTNPSSPIEDNGRRVVLSRFAAHPDRPENTGSWLLSRAVEWAKARCFDEFWTYAGIVNDNYGTMYDATGFRQSGVPTEANTAEWNNREGRTAEDKTWEKRRWERRLCDHDQRCRNAAYRDEDGGDVGLDRWLAADTGAVRPDDVVVTWEIGKDDAGRPVVSDAARSVFQDQGRDPPTLDDGGFTVFGAQANSELVGAFVVADDTGDGSDNFQSVTLTDAVLDGVKWPWNFERRFIKHLRTWADLHGFQRLYIDGGVYGRESDVMTGYESPDGEPDAVWQASAGRWVLPLDRTDSPVVGRERGHQSSSVP